METAIIALIRVLITEAPWAIAAIRKLINTENPTDADYDKAIEQIKKDSYGTIVTHSQLPPEE